MTQQKPDFPDWLEILCSSLNCSPQFRFELNSQLAKQAQILAGINVREGFALLPTDLKIHYDSDGVGHLNADLVAPDNFGYPVQIAWKCEAHPSEQIAPQDPLPQSEAYRLRVGWEDLPTEKLRAKYTKPAQYPFSISGNFSFEIEWQHFAWPDVCLEVQTKHKATEDQIKFVEVTLEKAREIWNRKPEEHGIIHNWSGLHRLDSKLYRMHIDFGSADLRAMSYWLKILDNVASRLSLSCITVKYLSA